MRTTVSELLPLFRHERVLFPGQFISFDMSEPTTRGAKKAGASTTVTNALGLTPVCVRATPVLSHAWQKYSAIAALGPSARVGVVIHCMHELELKAASTNGASKRLFAVGGRRIRLQSTRSGDSKDALRLATLEAIEDDPLMSRCDRFMEKSIL